MALILLDSTIPIPPELVEENLERIKRIIPFLNAFAELQRDLKRYALDAADHYRHKYKYWTWVSQMAYAPQLQRINNLALEIKNYVATTRIDHLKERDLAKGLIDFCGSKSFRDRLTLLDSYIQSLSVNRLIFFIKQSIEISKNQTRTPPNQAFIELYKQKIPSFTPTQEELETLEKLYVICHDFKANEFEDLILSLFKDEQDKLNLLIKPTKTIASVSGNPIGIQQQ